MLKRTIEISGLETALSLRYGQIHVKRNGKEIGHIPAEDVGMLIIDTPTAQYTHGTVLELARNGAAMVLCGDDHLPQALVMPFSSNTLQAERMRAQVSAKLPLKKRLWQQLVREKIRNQASNLDDKIDAYRKLLALVKKVQSGDPKNTEGRAARIYWPAWLDGRMFFRKRNGEAPNNLLNYGYAVLRAAVARAISGAGLHPSIGLHHHNRYDAFCLADDLIEPMRPLVDRIVRELFLNGFDEINKDSKKELLSMLLEPVGFEDTTGPLFVQLERMASSLVLCYTGESDKLDIPKLK